MGIKVKSRKSAAQSVKSQSERNTTEFQKGAQVISQKTADEGLNGQSVKPYTHAPYANEETHRNANRKDAKERGKSIDKDAKTQLSADLKLGKVKGNRTLFQSVNADVLREVCRNRGYKGYSGLNKDDLVDFLVSGGTSKPAPKPDSTAALRKQASALKQAGLITGPVSALKVADLKNAVATAKSGNIYQAVKSSPKDGTMDYNKNLIRNASGKGFTAAATAMCKKMFGEKSSVSSLKAQQLKDLVKALGLTK